MATDAVNITEDAEMAESDGDKVVTMMDVLQEQQDFEEDAIAVLGASDDKNCTYAKGYIKRQALYACLTCCSDVKTDPTKRAGVCLACSLHCHENHDLVELYTKRNFRCDCGNPKFNSHPCQFTPSKPELNDENIYNQNFSGLYCTCQRPYPDPEAAFEDDMIQCIICEDWLHASHLDTVVPPNDQYSEMICKGCMEKNEFLHDYGNFTVNVESDVDILTVNGDKPTDLACNGDTAKDELTNGDITEKGEVRENNINKSEISDACVSEKETSHQDTCEKKDIITDEGKNKMDLDAETEKEQECQATECNKTYEDSKGDEPVTISADDTKNETSDVQDSKIQKQEDVKSTNGDNAEVNKTEDQLLDDIRALTSGITVNEVPKSVENNVLEKSNPDEYPLESSKAKDDTNDVKTMDDKVEESAVEPITNASLKTSEDSSVSKAVTSHVEVPEPKESEVEKTDTVMDAIDALLKDPTEINNDSEDVKQNSIETQNSENTDNTKTKNINDAKVNEVKQDEVPEITDSTDIVMTDNKNQDDSSFINNKLEAKTLTNTEKPDITPSTCENTQSSSEVLAEKDKSENTILNETEPLTKLEDDSTSKNEPALDENNVFDTKETSENKRKLSVDADEILPKKAKLNIDKCVRPKGVKKVYQGATFWPSNFRQKLCTCGECISMYKDLFVLFLTDPEDTVSAYESLGKENVDGGASQYEKGLQALSSLDRIQQINALTEYNKMRDKLLDFLKSFKDRKEIVKEEDIKAFFAGMKPRREPDGVYFCR